jgi:hypothetical protein
MLDHQTFSALRLSHVFPSAWLADYPYYVELDPRGSFDTEYLGGQWHAELVDGVQFFYPAGDGAKLGVVELCASGCVATAAARDRPGEEPAALMASWAANANRVLETLQLPLRMGSPESAVRALAAGSVRRADFPDAWYQMFPAAGAGTVCLLTFACRMPDLYHLKATVHASEGLLRLEIRQPDLVRSNHRQGMYDIVTAGQYDEGPAVAQP